MALLAASTERILHSAKRASLCDLVLGDKTRILSAEADWGDHVQLDGLVEPKHVRRNWLRGIPTSGRGA